MLNFDWKFVGNMKKNLLFSLLFAATVIPTEATNIKINECVFGNELRVYRNPINNFTRIEFCQPENGSVKIDVINATGTIMESIPKAFETSGLKMIDLDTSQYRSGVYFVRVGNKVMKFLIG